MRNLKALQPSQLKHPPALLVLWTVLFAVFMVFVSSVVVHGQTAAEKPAVAHKPPPPPAVQLQSAEKKLDEISKQLKSDDTTDDQLQAMRERLNPVSIIMKEAIDTLEESDAAAKSRLDQLGPKPKEGAPPESAEVAAQRAALTKSFNEIDALLKRARVARVRVDQLTSEITNTRRELLQDTLFNEGRSALNPVLWYEAAREMPAWLSSLIGLAEDWYREAFYQLSEGYWLQFFATIFALALGSWLLWKVSRRFFPRRNTSEMPGAFEKVRNGIWEGMLVFAVPAVIAAGVVASMRYFYLVYALVDPFVVQMLEAVQHIALTAGLAACILAPRHSNWRLLNVDDERAKRLYKLAIRIVCIVESMKIANALMVMTAGPLVLSQVIQIIGSLAVAVVIGRALYGTAGVETQMDAELGPVIERQPPHFGLWRLVTWLAVVVVIGATLLGYLNLAEFITKQVVWITFVFAVAFLLVALIESGLVKLLQPESFSGQVVLTSFGFRPQALGQGAILFSGIAKVVIWASAAFVLLAPLGVETSSLLDTAKAAFFGFRIGDVKLSLSGLAMAVALLAAGFLATRAFQNWLEKRYLPSTALDRGLQNSISTSAGYIGVIAAIAFSLGYLGLNFEKLAFVAGALSLGIGFGLQAIVSNFVSGLILLWERSVKVGDWIVVGSDEGNVRRINVRSTEIETFDRQIVIIPNSNLISGVVKNWVSNNTTGRIIVGVGVSYDADPDKVSEILLACASTHELIMSDPAPRVVFADFGDSSLNFELRCYISYVDKSLTVRSHLRFEIFRRFKEAGIEIPFPQRDINLRDFDKMSAIVGKSKSGDSSGDVSATPSPVKQSD